VVAWRRSRFRIHANTGVRCSNGRTLTEAR
jgi:hypothetical protein